MMSGPQIIFLNEPKIQSWTQDTDKEKIELFRDDISHFISSHELFGSAVAVTVSFFHAGVSSLVCKLESNRGSWVLKMPLHYRSNKAEAQFFSVWKDVGVSVPKVIEDGFLNGHSYLLMNYIDAQPIGDVLSGPELMKKGVFKVMGRMLRNMHRPQAQGYGRVRDTEVLSGNFRSWVEGNYVRGRIAYVEGHQLIDPTIYGSIDEACARLVDFVASDPQSSYCHNDFSVKNIFNTDPLTVFDPDPMFNHPVIDVARSIVLAVSSKMKLFEAGTQFLQGYSGGDPQIQGEVLRAAMLLQVYLKLPYWHQTGQYEKASNAKEYLTQLSTLQVQ